MRLSPMKSGRRASAIEHSPMSTTSSAAPSEWVGDLAVRLTNWENTRLRKARRSLLTAALGPFARVDFRA